jgi:hypothetical protein
VKLSPNILVGRRRAKIHKFVGILDEVEQLRAKTLEVDVFPAVGA